MRIGNRVGAVTAARREDAASVLAALDTVPPQQRRAIVLAYYRSLALPGLMHVLSVDADSARAELHDGLHTLVATLRTHQPYPRA
ncbi:MAG: hypothetical protein ICV72_13360 [Aldersonia sp.]|nr:hypothetical protein [Aldersonia sp.]